MDYWISNSGETRGPYTTDQLRAMWGCGALTADTAYFDPTGRDWRPLRWLLERAETSPFMGGYAPPPPIPYQNSGNIFTFTGRWGRGRFCLSILGYSALSLGLGFLLLLPIRRDEFGGVAVADVSLYEVVTASFYFIGATWLYLMTCAAVKRMHDINWPAWGILTLPFMFTWFFLMLIGGHDGHNRYGASPKG